MSYSCASVLLLARTAHLMHQLHLTNDFRGKVHPRRFAPRRKLKQKGILQILITVTSIATASAWNGLNAKRSVRTNTETRTYGKNRIVRKYLLSVIFYWLRFHFKEVLTSIFEAIFLRLVKTILNETEQNATDSKNELILFLFASHSNEEINLLFARIYHMLIWFQYQFTYKLWGWSENVAKPENQFLPSGDMAFSLNQPYGFHATFDLVTDLAVLLVLQHVALPFSYWNCSESVRVLLRREMTKDGSNWMQ